MVNWSERGHVLVTRDDRVVYCRVVGQGNMNNCASFRQYSHDMRRRGLRKFILDFSDCDALDSTFLGVLVHIALGDGEPADVVVVNPRDSILKTFGEIGIDRLLRIHSGETTLPDVPLAKLDPIEETDLEHAEMMLDAHETLCEADPANLERFGAFLRMLKVELEGKNDS
ncbi:MAG: STAS domain-containing protein [Planctomycetota bacterium]